MIDWLELCLLATGICFISGFLIIIAVGWAHGGKYQMSYNDPALKNKISPMGKKWLLFTASLIFLSFLFAGIYILLI